MSTTEERQPILPKQLSTTTSQPTPSISSSTTTPPPDQPTESTNAQTMLIIFSISLLITSVLNNIFFKQMTNAMSNHPFFLSQLSTVIYIPVFFGITWLRYDEITPAMKSFPKQKFFLMGLFDAVSGVLSMIGAIHTGGGLQALLSNAIIPCTMLLSYFWIHERFNRYQIIGSGFITFAVCLAVMPLFLGNGGSDETNSDNQLVFVLLFVLNNIPSAFGSVYKESVFSELDMNENYLQAWVALFQLILGIGLIPFNTLSMLGRDAVEFKDILGLMYRGFWCLLGYDMIVKPHCINFHGDFDELLTSSQSLLLPPCDTCQGAWIPVTLYLSANLLYNWLMVVIIKIPGGGATLLYVIMSLRLPLVQLAFSFILVPPEKLHLLDVIVLFIILVGLYLYNTGGGSTLATSGRLNINWVKVESLRNIYRHNRDEQIDSEKHTQLLRHEWISTILPIGRSGDGGEVPLSGGELRRKQELERILLTIATSSNQNNLLSNNDATTLNMTFSDQSINSQQQQRYQYQSTTSNNNNNPNQKQFITPNSNYNHNEYINDDEHIHNGPKFDSLLDKQQSTSHHSTTPSINTSMNNNIYSTANSTYGTMTTQTTIQSNQQLNQNDYNNNNNNDINNRNNNNNNIINNNNTPKISSSLSTFSNPRKIGPHTPKFMAVSTPTSSYLPTPTNVTLNDNLNNNNTKQTNNNVFPSRLTSTPSRSSSRAIKTTTTNNNHHNHIMMSSTTPMSTGHIKSSNLNQFTNNNNNNTSDLHQYNNNLSIFHGDKSQQQQQQQQFQSNQTTSISLPSTSELNLLTQDQIVHPLQLQFDSTSPTQQILPVDGNTTSLTPHETFLNQNTSIMNQTQQQNQQHQNHHPTTAFQLLSQNNLNNIHSNSSNNNNNTIDHSTQQLSSSTPSFEMLSPSIMNSTTTPTNPTPTHDSNQLAYFKSKQQQQQQQQSSSSSSSQQSQLSSSSFTKNEKRGLKSGPGSRLGTPILSSWVNPPSLSTTLPQNQQNQQNQQQHLLHSNLSFHSSQNSPRHIQSTTNHHQQQHQPRQSIGSTTYWISSPSSQHSQPQSLSNENQSNTQPLNIHQHHLIDNNNNNVDNNNDTPDVISHSSPITNHDSQNSFHTNNTTTNTHISQYDESNVLLDVDNDQIQPISMSLHQQHNNNHTNNDLSQQRPQSTRLIDEPYDSTSWNGSSPIQSTLNINNNTNQQQQPQQQQQFNKDINNNQQSQQIPLSGTRSYASSGNTAIIPSRLRNTHVKPTITTASGIIAATSSVTIINQQKNKKRNNNESNNNLQQQLSTEIISTPITTPIPTPNTSIENNSINDDNIPTTLTISNLRTDLNNQDNNE